MTNGDMVFLLLMGFMGGMALAEFARRRSWWDLSFCGAYMWVAACVIFRNWHW